MNRSDDYGRRHLPEQRYGGSEEGYGHVPGGGGDWRRRDLSAGRYGNTRERMPNDAGARDGWSDEERDERAWRGGRATQGHAGTVSRSGTVYYPGRSACDDPSTPESPHERGYVTAYSSGYEDGYQAASRSANEGLPGAPERRRDMAGGGYTPGRVGQPGNGYGGAGAATQVSTRKVGPKNYTRSDERIREEVCERLAHEHRLDVSEVDVSVISGVVTLQGSVVDRRTKYEVEDIADETYGVSDVVNQLHVRPYGVLAAE